jgi:predicted heme/steroid binding protein
MTTINRRERAIRRMKFWCTLDRIAAWVLLAGMTLYFLSGYGMSKGIIDPAFATRLHTDILPLPIALAFLIHVGYATRLALIRWKAWRWPGQIAWVSFLILFLFASFFIDRIYRIPAYATSSIPTVLEEIVTASPSPLPLSSTPIASSPGETVVLAEAAPPQETANLETVAPQPPAQVEAPASQTASQTAVAERTFTQAELAQYDGLNGNPAYVAVNGVVYDLSRVFRSGGHFSHLAGQELTDAFFSYHATREITKYPVVGIYLP